MTSRASLPTHKAESSAALRKTISGCHAETYRLSATRDFRIVDAEGTSFVIKKKKHTILRGRDRGQSQSKMSYKRVPGRVRSGNVTELHVRGRRAPA